MKVLNDITKDDDPEILFDILQMAIKRQQAEKEVGNPFAIHAAIQCLLDDIEKMQNT